MALATTVVVPGTTHTSDMTHTGGTVDSNKVLIIKGPEGGVGQFKGLSQDTNANLYNEVTCTGAAPYF